MVHQPPIARPPVGPYQGREHAGVLRFDGIAFAQPPLGERRFRAPEPLPDHLEIRDALAATPAPLQRPGPALGTRPVAATSEDCLHLNVVTPALGGRRPVMVWIHGGGFTNGSAADPIHAGERLVRRGDLVLVTLDYRLGIFGFLHDPDQRDGSNIGLQDQLLALQWIQRNIAAFGGDAGAITLFGESAGAMSIVALMGAPQADTLFHRVILQSGAASGIQSPARIRELRTGVSAALGTPAESWQQADTETLLDAQVKVAAEVRARTGRGAWRLALDGEFVIANALDAQARAVNRLRPMLLGTNADEQRLYVNLRERLDESQASARLAAVLPRVPEPDATALQILRAYAALRPEQSRAELLAAIATDLHYRIPALQVAAHRETASAGTWLYRFDWRSPALRGRLGACHALEIPFVLGTLDAPGMDRFAGSGPDAQALSERMMDAWAAFAHRGDPEIDGWRPWRRDAPACWLADARCGVRLDCDEAMLAIWRQALPGIGL